MTTSQSAGKAQIPDNGGMPRFKNLREFFRFRHQWIHRAEFFRKAPIEWKDEQGLPNAGRKTVPITR